MRQSGDSDDFSPSYDVADRELSGKIDELLEKLKPYPHLDLIREIFVTGSAGRERDEPKMVTFGTSR